MEANIMESVNLKIKVNGEVWEIHSVWLDIYYKAVWYDGRTYRNGVSFHRIFTPKEIATNVIKEGE